jgi:PEP-CTERM motif
MPFERLQQHFKRETLMNFRTKFFISITLLSLLWLILPNSLRADSVFSNLGPGQTFNASEAYGLGPSGPLASPFVASETVTLTDVLLALSGPASGPGSGATVNFYIESDSAGLPSGTILDTLTTAGSISSTPSILTYVCSVCSQLTSGTTYFVVALDVSPTGADWFISNSDTGTFYGNETGSLTGPWSPATFDEIAAFQVDGTPGTPTVPEPSSLLLLSAGLLALLAIGRSKFAVSNRLS